ncbi:MAG: YihY/virulence factor BrkB family protein [Candidatus Krumholzibacteriia bacterium]
MAYSDYWKRNWIVTFRRVWSEMLLDDCFGAAAQLAYYFLLAFFPFVIFLVALVGFLPFDDVVQRTMELLARVMPAQALELVRSTVGVLERRNSTLLPLSVLGALLVASNGIRAVMVTLNRAYSVREGRALWRRTILAIGLTLALVATVIVSALLLSFSHRVGVWVAGAAGPGLAAMWRIASQVLGFAVLVFIVELIYHLAPNVRRPWHWITPGSVLAVLVWYLGVEMFTMYASRFGRYEVMYAGLGAVVVFLLWLYIAGLAVLMGGELNAELERSAGMIAPVAVPAPASVDAAGHDTTVRETLPDPHQSPAAAAAGPRAARAESPPAAPGNPSQASGNRPRPPGSRGGRGAPASS